MSILTFVRAPWYWIYAAFCFLSILSGVIILWYNRRNSAALYKTQTTYLLVAATVPFVVYGIYIANILPSKNFDINPFAFTFSAICICMGFLRHRLLDMSPVARDTLIENLPDGVVVLDMQNRVIDVNPSAMRIFGWTQPPTGLTAEHIWKSWPNLPGLFSRSEMAIVETQHNNPDGTEFCDVNYSLLKDSDGKPVGKVIIAHDITARKSIEHELQLSKETAESANEELRKAWVELAKSAETDYLTKSYNRRKFDEIVIVEMNRTSRYDTPLSLLMFDIDHFKLANDRYGHHAGDNLLVELVQFIKDHTRKPDILVRWGGEEFLLLTPGIALPQAVQLAEKLRGLIAAHVFSVLGTITISIGVTQYMSFDSSDSMVKRADDALYQAKANGRNCVVVGQVNVN
jgi:diguanylate cyclase (GGDEF)-like protein/PAS domain S-box-containing protein